MKPRLPRLQIRQVRQMPHPAQTAGSRLRRASQRRISVRAPGTPRTTTTMSGIPQPMSSRRAVMR